jgi:hypothetical protein
VLRGASSKLDRTFVRRAAAGRRASVCGHPKNEAILPIAVCSQSVKRVGGGIVGTGFFAFGVALSFGVISIGINAVGWIAIGMNAVGFISIGAINSIGVFAFGGVNSGGGWGAGLVNAGFSDVVGLALTGLVLVATIALRIRTWPRRDRSLFVPLLRAPDEEGAWALARVVTLVGSAIDLQDESGTLRVEVGAAVASVTKPPPRGALARVRLRRALRTTDVSDYRQDAALHVVELAEIVVEREGKLRMMFGDSVGVHLVCALLGTCASVAAFFLQGE